MTAFGNSNYCPKCHALKGAGECMYCAQRAAIQRAVATDGVLMPGKAPSSPAKPRLSLLPWLAMPSVARAMESGLKDGRQPHDYRKVPDRKHVYVDKALRHLAKHLGGELIDESGEPHLAHAVCDLLIAMEDT